MVVNAFLKVHHSDVNVVLVSMAKLVNWIHVSVKLKFPVDVKLDANHSVLVLLFLTFASSKMVLLTVYPNNKVKFQDEERK